MTACHVAASDMTGVQVVGFSTRAVKNDPEVSRSSLMIGCQSDMVAGGWSRMSDIASRKRVRVKDKSTPTLVRAI
ncbi:hypothetical protein Tco_1245418 [Tanacetum coccineum]